jgi:hypothetical protein
MLMTKVYYGFLWPDVRIPDETAEILAPGFVSLHATGEEPNRRG